tara:strand:+ start:196 stop:330 length:135 start_codon:yes stop_codon:yes gene_type:complete
LEYVNDVIKKSIKRELIEKNKTLLSILIDKIFLIFISNKNKKIN